MVDPQDNAKNVSLAKDFAKAAIIPLVETLVHRVCGKPSREATDPYPRPQSHPNRRIDSDGTPYYLYKPTINVSITFASSEPEHQTGTLPEKITKLRGEARSSAQRGYSFKALRNHLRWPDDDFNAVKGFIEAQVTERLDCHLSLSHLRQSSPTELCTIRNEATTKFDFLNAHSHRVVDDFIRIELRRQKALLGRKAKGKVRAV